MPIKEEDQVSSEDASQSLDNNNRFGLKEYEDGDDDREEHKIETSTIPSGYNNNNSR